jgi:hypothetical protein
LTGTVSVVTLPVEPRGSIELAENPAVTGTDERLMIVHVAPSTGEPTALMVWEDVEPLKMVTSFGPAVAVAERLTMCASINVHHVPGVPAVMQTQIVAVWSMMKSPTANVPDAGAPEAVAPTYLEADVAPVSPDAISAGAVTLPVNVAPDKAAYSASSPTLMVWAI